MNNKITENIKNQKEGLEQSSIENKVLEGSIDSNYDLNLAEGIEAYYSERYGWTLRRKSIQFLAFLRFISSLINAFPSFKNK